MELNPQIIQKNGKKEFAIFPYEEFLKIKEALDDYEDLLALRKAKKETVNEPSIPFSEIEKKFNNK